MQLYYQNFRETVEKRLILISLQVVFFFNWYKTKTNNNNNKTMLKSILFWESVSEIPLSLPEEISFIFRKTSEINGVKSPFGRSPLPSLICTGAYITLLE